jgi:ribosome-binding protein aMBF1 (putative translation factor)
MKPPASKGPRGSKAAHAASQVVREAIQDSGLPIRELARRTRVEPSVLSRFMNEQVGISLTTFEKLAPELRLRVIRESSRSPESK